MCVQSVKVCVDVQGISCQQQEHPKGLCEMRDASWVSTKTKFDKQSPLMAAHPAI